MNQVNQSLLNSKQDGNNCNYKIEQQRQCVVFWDYENIPTPRGVTPAVLYVALRDVINSLGYILK